MVGGGGCPVRHLPDPTLQLKSALLSLPLIRADVISQNWERGRLRDLFRSAPKPRNNSFRSASTWLVDYTVDFATKEPITCTRLKANYIIRQLGGTMVRWSPHVHEVSGSNLRQGQLNFCLHKSIGLVDGILIYEPLWGIVSLHYILQCHRTFSTPTIHSVFIIHEARCLNSNKQSI